MEDNLNMEYLPDDPNEKEIRYKEKVEKKLKDFRQYIVDKGVVLAFTKVLLSLKYSENKPKNPNRSIREFFGNYYDNSLEMQKSLNEEIIILRHQNPKLMEKVLELEEELTKEKRKSRIRKVFEAFYNSDPNNKNGLLSTKTIIEKINGNKKFEVDEKLTQEDFFRFIDIVCEGIENVVDALLGNLELAVEGNVVYKDDQDNVVYKRLVQVIKEMKKTGKK